MTENNDNSKKNIVGGVVIESLPNLMFRVQLDKPTPDVPSGVLLAYLAGKMKLHRIRVLVGDKVDVLLDPYGGKGRVVKRR